MLHQGFPLPLPTISPLCVGGTKVQKSCWKLNSGERFGAGVMVWVPGDSPGTAEQPRGHLNPAKTTTQNQPMAGFGNRRFFEVATNSSDSVGVGPKCYLPPGEPELYSEQQSCNTVFLYLDPIAQTLSSHEVLGNLKKVATRV